LAAEPRPWHRIFSPVAGELHHVVHRQKEGRVIELADQPQLFGKRVPHLDGNPVRKAPLCPRLRKRHQRVLRGGEALAGLVQVFGVLQLIEREAA
jgi:hypothetical protein